MKKTIFISSTYKDLVKERKAVWELLKRYDVNIVGMEEFGARKDSPLTTCLKEVEQSNIYIGIIANRWGSIEEESGKSYTQLEYEKAIEKDKEILISDYPFMHLLYSQLLVCQRVCLQNTVCLICK